VSGLVVDALLLNQCLSSVLTFIQKECRIFRGVNIFRIKVMDENKKKYAQILRSRVFFQAR